MAENCKFSQSSSLIIDGTSIIIVDGNRLKPIIFNTEELRLRQPIYIYETKVHALGSDGAVYEITENGYKEITEEGTVACPR